MSDVENELLFKKEIIHTPTLNLSLNEKQVQDTIVEFVWFFNGTNNIKFLIDNNHLDYVELLYNKYCREIDNLIKYYDLAEIIEESEFFHGWFNNWKQLEKYSKDQFLSKLKNDFEFSSLWADFGVSDSLELRNWGIQIHYDNEDRAKVSHQGKDQIKKLIDSLGANPESGFHFISLFNPTNIEDRLIENNWFFSKFYCKKLSYEERIKWFIHNFYETGMEYEVILETYKDFDLDNVKWYDEIIRIPKYTLNISSQYNKLNNQEELDKIILYNYLLLKYISNIFNFAPNKILIESTYKSFIEDEKPILTTYKFGLNKKNFDNLKLELNDYNFTKI